MNKSLALLTAIVIAVPLLTACATAATVSDEFIIPIDRYINFSNNLTVHLFQVTMSNITYYSTYTPNQSNTVWPVLLFQYENNGKATVACRFHVQIMDNTSKVPAGWNYDKTDETFYQPLYPNQKSSLMTMEFAMPKDRILSNLSIIDDGLKEEIARIPIVYPMPAPPATPTPGPGLFDAGNENLRNLMLIPILMGMAGLIGWFMARRRLF